MPASQDDFARFRVIRLNATISPVDEYEASLYQHYRLQPLFVEANTPAEINTYVSDCDAILVV